MAQAMKHTRRTDEDAECYGRGHLTAIRADMDGHTARERRDMDRSIDLLRAAPGMREALKKWRCPSCGGTGVYQQRSREISGPAQLVDCQKCNGTKLHPIAYEAIRSLEETESS
jgi:hypothetical protein